MNAGKIQNAEAERAACQRDAEALAGKREFVADGGTGIFVEVAIDVACEHWPFPVVPIFFLVIGWRRY
jgi:hypothetical protein